MNFSAEKRKGESFSDTITRLLESSQSDWRYSFGKLEAKQGEELDELVRKQRQDIADLQSERQEEVIE